MEKDNSPLNYKKLSKSTQPSEGRSGRPYKMSKREGLGHVVILSMTYLSNEETCLEFIAKEYYKNSGL